jgi:hypothetical protein
VFLVCAKLHARVDCRAIFDPLYDNYHRGAAGTA